MTSLTPRPSGFAYEHPGHGGTDEWYTPPHVFTALGLTFDLDPCSPGLDQCHVPALACYTKADDGLLKPWRGLVFCNPPYSQTSHWLRRMARHGNGVALVTPRTSTQWWQRYASRADVICFLARRLDFYRDLTHVAGKGATADSALLGYGCVAASAVGRCGLGHLAVPFDLGERVEVVKQREEHVEQNVGGDHDERE